MAVLPTVRYMILCEDWALRPGSPRRFDAYGILSTIRSLGHPAYPLLYREFCVVLVLTEGRGTGQARIAVVSEENGQVVMDSTSRPVPFGNDPLAIVGVPFRIRDCLFPRRGIYAVQFWYNELLIAERPLRLR